MPHRTLPFRALPVVAVVLALSAALAACSQAPVPTPDLSTSPEYLLDVLRTGDHRLLDRFEPEDRTLARLREREPAAPYALGRALEARGRDAAARLVYEQELAQANQLWAGLSAVRLARTARRTGNLRAAAGYGEQALRRVAWFPDAWLEAGGALYNDSRYDELQSQLATWDDNAPLHAGETISPGALAAEVALWQAVAAWETGAGPDGERAEDRFLRAFITIPSGPIHERLFLYLFYRDGALDRFATPERSLMDALYRYERGEFAEAARLIGRVDTATLLRDVRELGGDHAQDLGIWTSLERIVRDSGRALSGWVNNLSDAAAGAPVELQARAALVASYLPGSTPDALDALLTPGSGGQQLPDGAVRDLLLARWLALTDETAADPVALIAALAERGADAEVLAGVVDRSLPPLVRAGEWSTAERMLAALPSRAGVARARVALVLRVADASGLRTPSTGEAVVVENEALDAYLDQPSTHTWLRMLVLRERGRPQELPGPGSAGPASTGSASTSSSSTSPSSTSPASDRGNSSAGIPPGAGAPAADELVPQLAHVLALSMAGLERAALILGMDAARDPDLADDALHVARAMAEFGHTSNALDIARRATARSDRRVEVSLLPLLYPRPYASELDAAAAEFSLNRATLTALVREESHFRPVVRSVVGAQGLGQLMPDTADDIRRRMRWPDADAALPGDNLRMSAYYLAYLAEELDPPVVRLAAYNAGLGRGRRWQEEFGDLPPLLQVEALPFVETRWYLRRIAASRVVYRTLLDGVDAEAAVSEIVEGDIW